MSGWLVKNSRSAADVRGARCGRIALWAPLITSDSAGKSEGCGEEIILEMPFGGKGPNSPKKCVLDRPKRFNVCICSFLKREGKSVARSKMLDKLERGKKRGIFL